MRRHVCLSALALVIALTSANSSAVAGKPRPYKSRMAGAWDNVLLGFTEQGATFEASGQASHMGLTVEGGDLFFVGPLDPVTLTVPGMGSVTMTAANGDQLSFDYEGILFAATGEGIGTFTFTGGTGRFANVSGGGTFYALIDLSTADNQALTVWQEGEIAY